MGCSKSKPYIAKETYHPFENEWEGFTTQSFHEEDSKVIEFIFQHLICIFSTALVTNM